MQRLVDSPGMLQLLWYRFFVAIVMPCNNGHHVTFVIAIYYYYNTTNAISFMDVSGTAAAQLQLTGLQVNKSSDRCYLHLGHDTYQTSSH